MKLNIYKAALFFLWAFIATGCNFASQPITPCIEEYCLPATLDDFIQSISKSDNTFKIENRTFHTKIKLEKTVQVNGNSFMLEFSEANRKDISVSTSMTLVRKSKGRSENQCETDHKTMLDYLSKKFGRFKFMESTVPSDYMVVEKATSGDQSYRRIQSPRGQITFQSKLVESAAAFQLKILTSVFTSHRDTPDCNLLIWFQSD